MTGPSLKTPPAEETEGPARPKAKQSLGQNFLIHRGTIETIVARSGLRPGEPVVELGVGLGALTRGLAGVASRVIGIELDTRLIDWLREHGDLPENVEIRHQDMLAVSFRGLAQELGGKIRIVGNLPYNISSQIVFRLLEEREAIEWATLMFQKEVAERLVAKPRTKDYGILSVLTQYCAATEKIMDLPPSLFRPRPKITSTVIRVTFRQPARIARDFKLLTRLVKASFGQRRKKLTNALKGFEGLTQAQLNHALDELQLGTTCRAEELQVDDFVRLSDALFQTAQQK